MSASSIAVTEESPKAQALAVREMKEIESLWRAAFRRLARNRVAVISAVFLGLLILIAIVGPYLLPYGYAEQNHAAVRERPSWDHPMGTDQLGRDLLARLVFGARISLTVGFVVQFVILIIGVPVGAISGYAGGKADMARQVLAHLEAEGVLAGTLGPDRLRLVTHLDVDDDGIERACRALVSAP